MDEWIQCLEQVVSRHRRRLAALTGQSEKTRQYADWAKEGHSSAIWVKYVPGEARKTVTGLGSAEQDFASEIAEVISWREDPIVYRRNYGHVEVFHGRLSCGWLGDFWSKQLLGEAQKQGLRPCVACGGEALATRRLMVAS
ncbi:hypothetical protein ACFQY7_43935 [Actinomadura luteofluorescens]|uniref:Uncharacterized protein n=1 Tax=Actinomadura luteofluorescens TaxID=46163 RepID=A0A7Y9EH80_9ACTN|nr:hypothetical protein [Actinomadura luteofluorescens]NYD47597.1 hypothetical protein [Actinomadura luteofluorescens]